MCLEIMSFEAESKQFFPVLYYCQLECLPKINRHFFPIYFSELTKWNVFHLLIQKRTSAFDQFEVSFQLIYDIPSNSPPFPWKLSFDPHMEFLMTFIWRAWQSKCLLSSSANPGKHDNSNGLTTWKKRNNHPVNHYFPLISQNQQINLPSPDAWP